MGGTDTAGAPHVRTLMLILCLAGVVYCDKGSPAGPTVPLNQRFTLAPGETASIDGEDVRVQFVQVTGDSRCPADAVCIQGGDAIVHVRASDDRSSTPYELHTGDSTRASVTYKQLRIALVDLQPYPFSGRSIPPSDYRATLTVTRP